jgi:lipoate-protein ligase A
MQPLRFDPSLPSPYPTGEDVIDPRGPAFRAWIPQTPLLVLGNSQTPETELYVEAVQAAGVPVYQRKGGGGAVYLDTGCVCMAWRFEKRKDWSIQDYFGAGNGVIAQALRESFGITAVPRGISDLAVQVTAGDRKISGSSLYMPRDCALYLASILVSAPLQEWDRYLRHPSREPDYRGGRGHADFVVNLGDVPGAAKVTPEELREALNSQWKVEMSNEQ